MKVKELVEFLQTYGDPEEDVLVGININEGFVTASIVAVDGIGEMDQTAVVLFINAYKLTLEQAEEYLAD